MGFGPVWRQIGDDIAPVSPAVDTLRLFSGSEYGTIERDGSFLSLQPSAGGSANMRIYSGTSGNLVDYNGASIVNWKTDKIGVFATTAVVQQSKQADLTPGVSDLAAVATFCNTLQERLAIYGWLA